MAQAKKGQIKINEDTKRMAHKFDRVFASPDGVDVLNHLRIIFKDQMICRSDNTTEIIKAGAQHDVIIQIESMIDIAMSDKKNMDAAEALTGAGGKTQ